jgi:hypothetical protein
MKTIEQMKKELKDKIDSCKLIDYKMVEAKGLIGIKIVTEDFEEYQRRNLLRITN